MLRFAATLFLCLGLVFAGAHTASAGTVSLAGLLAPGATIVQGDKLFSDFSFEALPSGPNAADDASSIMVKPRTIGNDHGLEIFGGMFAGADSTLNILLGYKVTVLNDPPQNAPPGEVQLLTGIGLALNGSLKGTGSASITETVLAADQAAILGQFQATDPSPGLSQTLDLLNPVSMAFLRKGISLSGGDKGTAKFAFIDLANSQSFSELSSGNNVIMPEPATLLLLGTGILGLAGRVTRFRRR